MGGLARLLDGPSYLVAADAIASADDAIGAFGFATFILWAIWIIITSIIMFRAKEPAVTA